MTSTAEQLVQQLAEKRRLARQIDDFLRTFRNSWLYLIRERWIWRVQWVSEPNHIEGEVAEAFRDYLKDRRDRLRVECVDLERRLATMEELR